MIFVYLLIRFILFSIVVFKFIVVIVLGIELYVIVGCENFVIRIIIKIKVIKGIFGFFIYEVGIC